MKRWPKVDMWSVLLVLVIVVVVLFVTAEIWLPHGGSHGP
jgi:hypothetical protein